MKTKQILIILITILGIILCGCKKTVNSEAKADSEAGDEILCDTKEADGSDTQAATGTAAKDETAADVSDSKDNEDNVTNEDISWELLKQISTSEKKITSRYVGFYNDSYGISTAKYGVMYYTEDGGETWKSCANNSACCAGLEIIDENNAFMSANYSQVRVTTDGAKHWGAKPNFGDMANEHCRYLSFIDANTGWIANKKEIGLTTDGGATWTHVNVPTNIRIISAIWLKSLEEGYILNNKGVLFSTSDGGATWSEKDLGLKGFQTMVCPTAVLHAEDAQNFQIITYLTGEGADGCYYLSTSDGGDTWDKKELLFKGAYGFLHLNREGNVLTFTDSTDTDISVYQLKK